MKHIGDGNKMVSETPRTDAAMEFDPSTVDDVMNWGRQLERELNRCNNMFRKLDVHSLNLTDLIRKLERELREVQSENTRLRAALANSNGSCVYCTLPKEQWSECRSGFPGCARADDAMGCPELGAALELQEAQERIRLLIAERDSARQQADLNWKMREEFTALLGTDDVKEAVRGMKLMKAALECAVPSCDCLHHKKAHQHASGAKCVPEELVRMAQQISTTQTK